MKNRKLILLGAFVALSLTGCAAADETITKMTETMETLKDANGEITADVGIHMAVDEISMDVSMGMNGTWEMISEPLTVHFDGNMDAQIFGIDTDIEFYVVQEEDTIKTYVNYENAWTYETIEISDHTKETQQDNLTGIWEILESNMTVEETENAWHYEMEFTAEELLDMMSLLEEVTMEDVSGWVGTDVSGFTGKISFNIEKEKSILESATLDLTEGLDALIQGTIGMMGVDEASVSSAILEVNLKNYNEGISIELPQEAMAAEEISSKEASSIEETEQAS